MAFSCSKRPLPANRLCAASRYTVESGLTPMPWDVIPYIRAEAQIAATAISARAKRRLLGFIVSFMARMAVPFVHSQTYAFYIPLIARGKM
jgi:hypothetical protein